MADGRRPRILLTNDDGVRAAGLRAAFDALSELGDVTVVAPAQQRSGASHTITLEVPLRARPLKEYPGFMVDFHPVDCVKLALSKLLPEKPDIVVSGINRGTNAGHLVHYSGTVAAAKEAAMGGCQAVATSLAQLRGADFTCAARVTRLIVQRVLERPLPPGVVLNLNVPPLSWEELKGFRWARQSLQPLDDAYDERKDPRGLPYYWLAGAGALEGQTEDDDLSLIRAGYVTLTPLVLDWTDQAYAGSGPDYLEGLG